MKIVIEYKPEIRDALSALYASETTDPETTLETCRKVIEGIPSSYTAWQMYFNNLKASGEKDAEGEKLVDHLLATMPKNYQLWNFRRQLYLYGMSSAEMEMRATDIALHDDAKNYHAWAHRQAILESESKHIEEDLWEDELQYVDQMLEDDVFNNSAWTQRSFVVRHLSSDLQSAEIDATIALIRLAPRCVAAWNYLRHILWSYASDRVFDVVTFSHEILSQQSTCLPCLEFLADVYCVIAERSDEKLSHQCRASASKIWMKCIEIDPIRCCYWTSRITSIRDVAVVNPSDETCS